MFQFVCVLIHARCTGMTCSIYFLQNVWARLWKRTASSPSLPCACCATMSRFRPISSRQTPFHSLSIRLYVPSTSPFAASRHPDVPPRHRNHVHADTARASSRGFYRKVRSVGWVNVLSCKSHPLADLCSTACAAATIRRMPRGSGVMFASCVCSYSR